MRFWSQIVAFYFLVYKCMNFCHGYFHNIECGNKYTKLKRCLLLLLLLLLLLSLFSLDCIGLAYGDVTWWSMLKTEDSKDELTLINYLSGSYCTS